MKRPRFHIFGHPCFYNTFLSVYLNNVVNNRMGITRSCNCYDYYLIPSHFQYTFLRACLNRNKQNHSFAVRMAQFNYFYSIVKITPECSRRTRRKKESENKRALARSFAHSRFIERVVLMMALSERLTRSTRRRPN